MMPTKGGGCCPPPLQVCLEAKVLEKDPSVPGHGDCTRQF